VEAISNNHYRGRTNLWPWGGYLVLGGEKTPTPKKKRKILGKTRASVRRGRVGKTRQRGHATEVFRFYEKL